jgi:Holliday junction resolvase
MTSSSKQRGSRWELDVVKYLRESGFKYAERAYGAGRRDDKGDITGFPGWVFECKNHKAMDLAGWMDETDREKQTANAEYGVAIIKRRNKQTKDGYVLMTLEQFSKVLKDLQ